MKKIYTICCLWAVVLLSSCSNWLDLKPYGKVEADKMFETEQGFIQTLTGTYLLLTDPSAYGYELTGGFPDEIVHYWKEQSEFYNFNYKDASVVGRLDATWAQLYEAIANTNLLLDHLEGRDPSEFDHYQLIKGEALGLRAYLHLDLLRLYGPVLKEGGMQQKAIPYHEEFSNSIVQVMTAEEVIACIERDLDSAYVLLQDDPIKLYGRDEKKGTYESEWIAPEVKGLAYSYRGSHFNYYAVCATLARLHQLKSEQAEALKYAMEVMEASDIFEFVRREDLSDAESRDRVFEREVVWSLYDQNTNEHLAEVLKSEDHQLDDTYMEWTYMEAGQYDTEEDYRYNYWFTYLKASPSFWYVSKYERQYSPDSKKDNTPWRTAVPMIRLSEMYYIAAEANLETNPIESFRLLNTVRQARNVSTLPATIEGSSSALKEQLIAECRKEYWGEGKLFYFYKRLFLDIKTREEKITASRDLYELPIPQDEIEFGDNNN